MSKKLLEESTIRQFMKLAQLEPLAGDFLEEKRKMKRMEEGEKKPGQVEGDEDGDGDVDKDDVRIKADKTAKKVLGKHFQNEQMTDTMEEEMIDEMGGDYPMEEMMDGLYEEEDEDMGVEMEAEEGDMEAEINITPDQARAIIAVADMLKDIMPDLEAPEAEEEEEVEMDMEEPVDMGAEEEEEGEEEVAAGAGEEEEGAEEEAEGEEEEALAEAVMRRVKARLREMKNK
jgi:hypothetical protein